MAGLRIVSVVYSRSFWLLPTLALIVAVCHARSVAEETGHSARVLDQPISDHEHFEDGRHNVDYDHDAILDSNDQQTFRHLSIDESRQRLGNIFDKIDKNGDGFISHDELKNWIHRVQTKYLRDDVERQWKEHGINGEYVSWDDYKAKIYGFLDSDDGTRFGAEERQSYDRMIRRDERRWQRADSDGDGKLTRDEFGEFLHPEDSARLKDLVVQETLEDIDKNHDGYIDLDEYIQDMWPEQGGDGHEPSWVSQEKEHFRLYRDKDKDGKMDFAETRDWVMPVDYDHAEAESRHLIFESDVNKDGAISKEEMLAKYDMFVGSQATDYGDALMKHDEL